MTPFDGSATASSADSTAATCLHCGLPLAHATARFCCYGCSIVHELTGTHQREEQGSVLILMRLGIAGFLAANVMVLTWASYGERFPILFPIEDAPRQALHFFALLLSLPVFALVGVPYLRNAWREVRDRAPGVDTLIAAGTMSALAVSIYGTMRGTEQVYFDTASTVLVLVTFGRYLESTARLRTTSLLRSFKETVPEHARRLTSYGEEAVPVRELQPGDLVRILPGEQVPVDGVIVEGETSVDQALLTGESLPVGRSPGQPVLGGSVNHDGSIVIRVTSPSGATLLAQLTTMVEERLSRRSKTQKLMDSTASWFTPTIIFLAVGVAAFGSIVVGLPPEQTLLRFLSVLLIACPCALGIGTSLAESVAYHRALHAGILCRSLDTLEDLGRIGSLVLDKTGTVTKGEASVTHVQLSPRTQLSEQMVCSLAASLERHALHPFARAIVAFSGTHCKETGQTVTDIHVLPGRGITGYAVLPRRGRSAVTICRFSAARFTEKWLDGLRVSSGISTALLLVDEEVQAVFFLRDAVRDEASSVVAALHRNGVATMMVSGDSAAVVEGVAAETGILRWEAGLLPAEKAAIVEAQRKEQAVAMVGDGINDAPALASATCGIAFNAGTDLSRQAADVVIRGGSLWTLPWLHQLGREVRRTVRWNIVWMLVYNVVGVVLAAIGVLHPAFAALAMVASSGMVIANSSRLAHCRLLAEKVTAPE